MIHFDGYETHWRPHRVSFHSFRLVADTDGDDGENEGDPQVELHDAHTLWFLAAGSPFGSWRPHSTRSNFENSKNF